MTDGQIKIRVTVTAEVTDVDALTRAALALLDEAVAGDEDEVDLDTIAELRDAIPDDPSAAVVALVDPGAPLEDIPGLALLGVDVEVGPAVDEDGPAIQLP